MPIDKQRLQNAQHRICQSIAMIAGLRSNVEHHLADLQGEPMALEGASNLLAEEIGQLREVYNGLCAIRYQALLPDSGVQFETLQQNALREKGQAGGGAL